MSKILVSACLLGNPVRYDGKAKTLHHARLSRLVEQDRVIGFCPEVAGGLPIPRDAAEIRGGDGAAVIDGRARVETRNGCDVTAFYVGGARQALALCRQHGIGVAILTESSPSCGSSQVYDGEFARHPVPGSGVTAALLRQHGIAVFNQHQIDAALGHPALCEPGAQPQ
ncbi:MAG: DUF523 domain-containing protein [Gammaproteobacteria bacterium]|nr:DUF523 domain-containing protein [Gammaproteobacteria bacterium]